MQSMQALEIREITKRYDSLVANDKVSMVVNKGEIHALVGENGAGKSTLMKILFGFEHADSGSIYVNGQLEKISSPAEAMSLGIGMVHQSFKLVESLTVAENVVLGKEGNNRFGFLDLKTVIKNVKETAQRYKLKVDPLSKIADLSVGQRQTVEILKVLYRNTQIILLDEPTSILTPGEVNSLFESLRELVRSGRTIVFVTHRLREVFALSNHITILRKGKVIGTFQTGELTPEQVSDMMIGRKITTKVSHSRKTTGTELLRVDKVSCTNDLGATVLNTISFSVHEGEILGVAGVSGNGQTELVEVLSGLRQYSKGIIRCGEQIFPKGKPRSIRNIGIGIIPEDRLKTGLAVKAKIEENLILNKYYFKPLSQFGLLNPQKINQYSNTLIKNYDIRTSNGKMPAESLSGGNQQKVIVAREMCEKPQLLIMHEPTLGLDVGAMEFVYSGMINHVQNGGGILLVSTDLDEILQLSDRIIVIYHGEIVGEFSKQNGFSEIEIGQYMLGLKKK